MGGLRAALAALLLAGSIGAAGQPEMPRAGLVIETGRGAAHAFRVEVASTPEHRSRGLMYRWSLGLEEGMLFVFDGMAPISMWMRNTFIPLTMLFIDGEGRIVRVVDETTPMSDDSILSGGPVKAVLELVAGSAARLDIQVGDRLDGAARKLID